MTNIAPLYSSPECELSEVRWGDMLCESPVDGGAEGTGEEEWII